LSAPLQSEHQDREGKEKSEHVKTYRMEQNKPVQKNIKIKD
jgi:hypothetical protein